MNEDQNYTNEDFFKIIGKLSILLSNLDFLITQLIFRIGNIEKLSEQGLKIKDDTTLGGKLDIIEKLNTNNTINNNLLKKVKKIYPDLKKINGKRKRYIHDLFEFKKENISNGKINRFHMTGYKKWFTNSKKVELSINDINSFAEEVEKNIHKIIRIGNELPLPNPTLIKYVKQNPKKYPNWKGG